MHLILCHDVQNMQSFVVYNCFKFVSGWFPLPVVPSWLGMTTKSLAVVNTFTDRPHISHVSLLAGVLLCTVCVFIKRAEVTLRWRVVNIAHLCGWFPNFSLKRDKTTNEKQNICIGLLLYLISVLYTCLFIHLMLRQLQKHLDKSFFL